MLHQLLPLLSLLQGCVGQNGVMACALLQVCNQRELLLLELRGDIFILEGICAHVHGPRGEKQGAVCLLVVHETGADAGTNGGADGNIASVRDSFCHGHYSGPCSVSVQNPR